MKTEIARSLGTYGWTVMLDGYPVGANYKLKRDAEADVTVARALVDAMRAAGTAKQSKLDWAVWALAEEILNARATLIKGLERIAERAQEDAARVRQSGMPWYSPGSATSTGAEIDMLHVRFLALGERYRELRAIVRDVAPTSEAAVAMALYDFASWAGR